MDRKRHSTEGPPPLDLIEEAVHLLRQLPLSAWLNCFIGMFPFALAFLFFQADMGRGAAADERLATSALTLALLYLWMKDRQSAFARALRESLRGHRQPSPTWRQRWHLALINAFIHPTGLLLIPIAAVITLPFPWVIAFYQNVSALADGEEPSLRRTIARAGRQAGLWTSQNVTLQLILQCFAFIVFLNWFLTLGQLPHLLKIFFGIETPFTRSGIWSFFNTTYLFTVCTLTWLCVSPIFRAVYTLRCFYGESLTTGEDLRGELKTFASRKLSTGLALLWLLAGVPFTTQAADPSPGFEPQRVERLDAAFDGVLQDAEFAWRSPRSQTVRETEKGWLGRQLEKLAEWIHRQLLALRDVIKRFVEWLIKFFKPKFQPQVETGSGTNWQAALQLAVYILIATAILAILLLVFRLWRQPAPKIATVQAVVPDLSDDDVTADELPEDEWLKLAAELLSRGDARLALRALYLASLAHLGERELLTISRAKSNREYQRELRRRARSLNELLAAFDANVLAFERAWYGVHEVTRSICNQAEDNLRRIRQC